MCGNLILRFEFQGTKVLGYRCTPPEEDGIYHLDISDVVAVVENETLEDGAMQLRDGQTEDVLQLAQKNVLLGLEATLTPAKLEELLADVEDDEEGVGDKGEDKAPALIASSEEDDDDLGDVANVFLSLGSKFALKAPKAAAKPKTGPKAAPKAKAALPKPQNASAPAKAAGHGAATTKVHKRPAPCAATPEVAPAKRHKAGTQSEVAPATASKGKNSAAGDASAARCGGEAEEEDWSDEDMQEFQNQFNELKTLGSGNAGDACENLSESIKTFKDMKEQLQYKKRNVSTRAKSGELHRCLQRFSD